MPKLKLSAISYQLSDFKRRFKRGRKSGFTIVELLVTISIIAILAAIGMVAYSQVLRQGRDSKRQSDLRMIQSALEQYYADQFYYPSNNEGDCADGTFKVNCALKNPAGDKTYLNTIPADSIGDTQQYIYSPSGCTESKCSGYCMYAKLENPPNPSPSPPSGCNYPKDYTFAVSTP